MTDTPCRFCRDGAVVLVAVDRGCACAPDDREQALCCQHYVKATPLGDMRVVRWLAERIDETENPK